MHRRLATAALLSTLALAPSAFADPAPDDVRWMVLRAPSGVCLDGSTSKVRAAACTGEVGQVWSFQGDHLVSGDGRCLSVAPREAGLDGARLLVAACVERDEQRFERRGRAIVDGHGLCVEARASRRGTDVQTWECVGDADGQRWAAMAPESFVPEDDAALDAEPGYVDATTGREPEPILYDRYEPAVVVHGPATIYTGPQVVVPPVVVQPAYAPPAPDPVDQVFRVMDYSIHTFRSLVDAFSPRPVDGWGRRW